MTTLLTKSFEERLWNGLNFTCSNFSPDELFKHTEGKYIFTLKRKDLYITMLTLSVAEGKGHMEYVAIHPDYKGSGIASVLYSIMEQYAKSLGLECITSTTACKAVSSVKWHKKMGFMTYGLGSDELTNYYSYLFRKPIKKNLFNSNPLIAKLTFILYFIAIKLGKTENGQLTGIGVLLLKIKKLVCSITF